MQLIRLQSEKPKEVPQFIINELHNVLGPAFRQACANNAFQEAVQIWQFRSKIKGAKSGWRGGGRRKRAINRGGSGLWHGNHTKNRVEGRSEYRKFSGNPASRTISLENTFFSFFSSVTDSLPSLKSYSFLEPLWTKDEYTGGGWSTDRKKFTKKIFKSYNLKNSLALDRTIDRLNRKIRSLGSDNDGREKKIKKGSNDKFKFLALRNQFFF